jgi:hypothetical protein
MYLFVHECAQKNYLIKFTLSSFEKRSGGPEAEQR